MSTKHCGYWRESSWLVVTAARTKHLAHNTTMQPTIGAHRFPVSGKCSARAACGSESFGRFTLGKRVVVAQSIGKSLKNRSVTFFIGLNAAEIRYSVRLQAGNHLRKFRHAFPAEPGRFFGINIKVAE